MCGLFMLCLLLGVFAVSTAAMSIETAVSNDGISMNAEEELPMNKLEADLQKKMEKDLAMTLLEDQSLEKRAPTGSGDCSVDGYSSQCCGHISFRAFLFQTINLDGCVYGEYLPDEYGLRVKATINGQKIIDETVSAANPPAICSGIPRLKFVTVCIKVSDVRVNTGDAKFHGCFRLETHLFGIKRAGVGVDLGCVNIG